MQPDNNTIKLQLRRQFKATRQSLRTSDCEEWSKAMAQDLILRLKQIKFDGVLFLYFPMMGEPNLLEYLRDSRFHIALPVSAPDGQMKFYIWDHLEPLNVGEFKISEPFGDQLEVFPRKGDCIVVPALAIDQMGHRLGMGKGYYDRWLREFKSSVEFVAGAVYPPFFVKEVLPVDDHDVHIDFVLKS